MKKKIISIMLAVSAMISQCVMAKAESMDIGVYVDGYPVEFDVAPAVIDSRTMVPVRAIFEAMGATVEWNPTTKEIISKKDNTIVKMTLGSKILEINGTKQEMDVCPAVIDSRTLVPARFAAESFNGVVRWDGETNEVIIYQKDKIFTVEGRDIPDLGKCLGITPVKEEVIDDYIVYEYQADFSQELYNNLATFAMTLDAYGYTETNAEASNDHTYSEFIKAGQGVATFSLEITKSGENGLYFKYTYKK